MLALLFAVVVQALGIICAPILSPRIVTSPVVSSFVLPSLSVREVQTRQRPRQGRQRRRRRTAKPFEILGSVITGEDDDDNVTWEPQDLTKDNEGYPPIPSNDYVKQYQASPTRLWPVEFFVVAYRRNPIKAGQVELLVRPSSNGTSKYGLGTGVPVTRWGYLRSDGGSLNHQLPQKLPLPQGYDIMRRDKDNDHKNNNNPLSSFVEVFDAKNFPEFVAGTTNYNSNDEPSWSYSKLDLKHAAFQDDYSLMDPELEEYATRIRNSLKDHLSSLSSSSSSRSSEQLIKDGIDETFDEWESIRTKLIAEYILNRPNSVTAIQGSLRMSGLFAYVDKCSNSNSNSQYDGDDDGEEKNDRTRRYIPLNNAPDPSWIATQSTRIYTMFPQMPNPLPHPETPASELRHELQTRPERMATSGRNPHVDKYGRKYTHISTSNVSNTIHGIYMCLDATNLILNDGDSSSNPFDHDNIPPALDLFGTQRVNREWKSLQDLKVLTSDGTLDTTDPKPTFISGFIVRQLVKEGIIPSR